MAISVEYIEFRETPRQDLTAPVRCVLVHSGMRHDGIAVDLTTRGMGLVLSCPLALDEAVAIEGLEAGAQRGRVRWIRKMQDGYRIGLTFEDADQAAA
ncbi:MAG: PilZ domain-containing protein [Gammaproteobacteria bacterium]|nr:PilZ domain-containing protein [Gammaproteobacteria bacterium]